MNMEKIQKRLKKSVNKENKEFDFLKKNCIEIMSKLFDMTDLLEHLVRDLSNIQNCSLDEIPPVKINIEETLEDMDSVKQELYTVLKKDLPNLNRKIKIQLSEMIELYEGVTL